MKKFTSGRYPGTLGRLPLSHPAAEDPVALDILAPDADVPSQAGGSGSHAAAGDGVASNGQDLHVAALGVVVHLRDVLDERGAVAAARSAAWSAARHVQEGF